MQFVWMLCKIINIIVGLFVFFSLTEDMCPFNSKWNTSCYFGFAHSLFIFNKFNCCSGLTVSYLGVMWVKRKMWWKICWALQAVTLPVPICHIFAMHIRVVDINMWDLKKKIPSTSISEQLNHFYMWKTQIIANHDKCCVTSIFTFKN